MSTLPDKTMAIVTLVFGWFYGWASPWAFPKNRPADFKYGVLHGALMPLSLPTLLLGKDVPIFASDTSGRGYKIDIKTKLMIVLIFFLAGKALANAYAQN